MSMPAQGDAISVPGIPTRATLLQIVETRIALGRRLAVILCDIDRFKLINYSLGRDFADRVLRQMAEVLREALGPEATVGRWGGPEFLCVINETHDVDALIEHLRQRIERLVILSKTSRIHITASFGVASFPEDGGSAADLLNAVEAALYHAKNSGRNRAVRATTVQKRLLGMGAALETALHEQRIVTAYQPIVDLRSGRIVGEEALARMLLPNGRILAAEEFIEVSQHLQLTYKIDQSVIRAVLTRCMESPRDTAPLAHFVNISADLLRHPEVVQDLLGLIGTYCEACQGRGETHGTLVLELTEREPFADNRSVRDLLMGFVHAGVKLALDDFGRGYSSFQYLADLPFSYLKLEGSLVSRIHEPTVRAIIQGIQRIAEELKITTLAEGVETAETAAIVTDLGIDWAQGFLYGRAGGQPSLAARRP
ncbi:bifunctional diguanylate cyclase/phosphodiesterase [Acidiferrobacter sp.]|uniref:bifunctional diguanylate cyclase/phosphodiesterase n=1 Tax=Acidiferrobacter sp. TaxID=1872107 RepID=UPI0026259DC2|nr:bifunctional diguanylate cyclase/phosphodiesterase [Acidiferrobacter sp.]